MGADSPGGHRPAHLTAAGAEATTEPHTCPVACPPGSEPYALVHIHPGGVTTPSAMDVKNGQRFRMAALCIASDKEMQCYPVPKAGGIRG